MSVPGCENVESTLGGNFNCCTALGTNLSVGPPSGFLPEKTLRGERQ